MMPKSVERFEATLSHTHPPEDWPLALQSLWYAANGNWEASHNIAQDLDSQLGSWIHAYLHREEGDDWNAKYWYRMANRPFPQLTLKEELYKIIGFAIS